MQQNMTLLQVYWVTEVFKSKLSMFTPVGTCTHVDYLLTLPIKRSKLINTDLIATTLATFLFSSHPKKGKGSRGLFKLLR